MRGALGGPRLLLRRLREIMAEPVSAQARLDKIVVQIAANMVAEVCSVYVLRADGGSSSYATEGLNREAVHLTTMHTGEGLVGLIAEKRRAAGPRRRAGTSGLLLPAGDGRRNLSLLPRRADPARRQYARRARRAEPRAAHLFRGGSRGAADDGDAARRDDRLGRIAVDRPARAEHRARPADGAQGRRRSRDGVGLGHVVLHEPRVVVKQLVAEDPKDELERLETAIDAMRASIDELVDARRPLGRRRASRRARSLPHVRL